MSINSKLQRFPRSNLWDSRTQKIVDGLRAYIHREPQPTITKIQQDSIKGRPLSDDFHCFQETFPEPDNEVNNLLLHTIDAVKKIDYEIPNLAPVTVEWVSKRAPTRAKCRVLSPISQQWESMAKDAKTNLTILHVHGGAFFQGSPEAYRPTTSQLAEISGGRVISVKYRLAPQHPFPAGLLDVFTSYLSLLYPHPLSAHRPIDPSTVVFAGDSSGANLLYAVLQIIQLTQQHSPITFHSHTVTFPLRLPAGLASLSFAGDTLNCLPSYILNRVNDLYLDIPWSHPSYPTCELWPVKPPRSQIYAALSAYGHPFISPILPHDCEGMPPMWFAVGEEQFIDGSRAVARRAAQKGVQVDWMQFEAMPHCFAALPGLNTTRQAKTCMQKWATFCKECVEPKNGDRPESRAVKWEFSSGVEKEIALEDESALALPLADVERRIHARIEQYEDEFRINWQRNLTAKL